LSDFDVWWLRYPRKVGKFAAAVAYRKARTQATPAELLAGLDRYLRDKPAFADWCHPVTWLRQGRWLDEIGPVAGVQADARGHVPPCASWAACTQRVCDEARAARERVKA
jgi:hypothetical protein